MAAVACFGDRRGATFRTKLTEAHSLTTDMELARARGPALLL